MREVDGLERYRGADVLAVGAHPDDLEVGAGGTLARLAQSGARVVMAVLSVPSLPLVRVPEARRAAELLGCKLKLITSDGRHVEDLKTYELVAALDAIIKDLKPVLLIAHAICDNHRDHQLAGQAALAAQRLGRFDYWRYATSLRAPTAGPFHPALFIEITATLELKLAAISAHYSQFGKRGRDTGLFRELAREQGFNAGVPYAEAFEVGRVVIQA